MCNVKDNVEKFLASTEGNIKFFVDHTMGIASSIDDILNQRGLTYLDLARKLQRQPEEVKKWLSGTYNFAIDVIAEIEEALGEQIIFTKYDKS